MEKSFLTFIRTWLYYSGKNKDKIFNKLSINFTLWRMSLVQITKRIVNSPGLSFTKSTNIDLIYNIANKVM